MKKVLFVATVVKLHIMVFHIPFLKWFKENGYEVHVAARNDYDDKQECNIPFCDKFYDLPFERSPFKGNNIIVTKELKEIIGDNEYEIIHCHTPIGGVIGRLAGRNARNRGTKIIYTAHGFHFYKGAPLINWLVYYPVEWWLARYTDILITINEEDFKRANTFQCRNIEYVPGVGVDNKLFNNIDEDWKEKRESIGIKDNDFMILSVGELNKNKNHQVIIKAISRLKNKEIKYVICGQGSLEKKLKDLVVECNLQAQVIFLGFRNDIPELLNAADLFAFPSYREGLSLSLMEAMASGLPCVVSKIRGNVDLIKNNQGGYLIEANDIAGFQKGIDLLFNDDKKRKDYSLFNKEYIKSYSRLNVKEKMKQIYLAGR